MQLLDNPFNRLREEKHVASNAVNESIYCRAQSSHHLQDVFFQRSIKFRCTRWTEFPQSILRSKSLTTKLANSDLDQDKFIPRQRFCQISIPESVIFRENVKHRIVQRSCEEHFAGKQSLVPSTIQPRKDAGSWSQCASWLWICYNLCFFYL